MAFQLHQSFADMRLNDSIVVKPSHASSFGLLPTEMKMNIFAFICTKLDKRTLCLVNREFRALVLPSLWEEFASDFMLSPRKSLTVFLQPNSIIPLIKRIYVRAEGYTADSSSQPFAQAVQFFVSSIPKDQLKAVQSFVTLPDSVFARIVQSQRRLGTLDIPWYPQESTETIFRELEPSISSTLQHMNHIAVYVDPNCHAQNANCRFILENISNIKVLEFWSIVTTQSLETALQSIFPSSDVADEDVMKVLHPETLILRDLNLEVPPITLFKYVDFSCITHLVMKQCAHAARFLEALGTFYLTTLYRLSRLDLFLKLGSRATLHAVKQLLLRLPPLQALYVDCGGNHLLEGHDLARHSQSLQTLWLSKGRAKQLISAPYFAIDSIYSNCTSLEQLAVPLPSIQLDPVEGGTSRLMLDETNSMLSEELEYTLDRLAMLRALHTLRFLTLPIVDYQMPTDPNSWNRLPLDSSHVQATQVIMQRFATQVMRHLTERGSNVKVLALSRYPTSLKLSNMDANGHRWPHYNYVRSWVANMEGSERVTAVPLKHAKEEMPASTILWEY